MDIRVLLTKFTTFPIIFACIRVRWMDCTNFDKNILEKDYCIISNELRHLCPLNPIPMPDFFFDGFKNELRHLRPLNRIQIFQNFSATPWKWTTEGFKTDCGQNLWIEISFFNIFWQTYTGKNTFKISLPYLENELRHLCPLNPIQTPDFFSMGSKMNCAIYWVASMSLKSHSNLSKFQCHALKMNHWRF